MSAVGFKFKELPFCVFFVFLFRVVVFLSPIRKPSYYMAAAAAGSATNDYFNNRLIWRLFFFRLINESDKKNNKNNFQSFIQKQNWQRFIRVSLLARLFVVCLRHSCRRGGGAYLCCFAPWKRLSYYAEHLTPSCSGSWHHPYYFVILKHLRVTQRIAQPDSLPSLAGPSTSLRASNNVTSELASWWRPEWTTRWGLNAATTVIK